MNIPRFTADASLYKTRECYQSAATRVDSRGHQEVVPQRGWERAQWMRQTLGFGTVHCFADCSRVPPGVHAVCPETCYWWPY